MKFIELKYKLKDFPVFSYSDIRKLDPGFHRNRLYEWQIKGHVQKIRKGYYCFIDQVKNEAFLFYSANRIYKPSYITLETALSYYGLIPEGVFTLISISTKKTYSIDSPIGSFEYHNVKPTLFFGYQLVRLNGYTIKIAEPEKAILDYLYLRKPADYETIEALRIDPGSFTSLINYDKMIKYLNVYSSLMMNKRFHFVNRYFYA
ncbi:MAG: hypothetical protein KAT48_12415 [Bacteroidales bacterium]|nr:hypothetical protein [Bacteroidales bacterium]